MLDHLAIFTRGGLVLWTFQLSALKGSPIDALVQTCLLQERSGETFFHYGKDAGAYTLKWTFHNELGLVFVAVYQRILQLLYVDEILSSVKQEFTSLFKPGKCAYPEFDDTFQQLLLEAEDRAKELKLRKQMTSFSDTKKGQQVNRQNGSALKVKNVQKGSTIVSEDDGDSSGGDGGSGGEPNGVSKSILRSDKEGTTNDLKEKNGNAETAFDVAKLNLIKRGERKKKPTIGDFGKLNGKFNKVADDVKKKAKENRTWDDGKVSAKQDFSDPNEEEVIEVVDVKNAMKSRIDEDEQIDEDAEETSDEEDNKFVKVNGSRGPTAPSAEPRRNTWLSSLFQSVAGKVSLDRDDVEPALKALKDRFMSKNVAEEIANKLCESVAASLIGRKQASFTRISSTVQAAMEEALLRILTPKRSVDILRDVHAAKEQGRPYVIVFVGVNGVGKSTNLAKVAYWLLQHDVKVMLAACDTFRAGAVEQLRTHARRLDVPLFERGYEKDPASVARDAIKEACRQKMEAVLVDTAGRMQDNEPLMRALSKLISLNNPDLCLFVGEALVGNDAVDQLTKFNQRLADLSTSQQPQAIDGILLTKFDTIDDKVGAALSMVYISGAPIMFVGCGQGYTDLKKLNVHQIIKTLLK